MLTQSSLVQRASALVFLILFSHVKLSMAQEIAYYESPRPTISRAADFISTLPVLKVNSDLKFVRLNTPEAKKIVTAGLQVRIFPLAEGEKTPAPHTIIEKCHVYLTTIYPISRSELREVTIATTDAAWLSLSSSRQSFNSGHYFLVFETEGADDRIFRLNATDAKAYFAQGFPLTVETDTGVYQILCKRVFV